MGQGKGGAATSRKADNAGKEEHKCFKTKSGDHIICTSCTHSALTRPLCWTLLDSAATCWQDGPQADWYQEPHKHMPKLFGPLRERYLNRPGGYTRVLRIEPLKPDQAPSAILELVDGPKDIRFAMTAKALVKQREEGMGMNEITAVNLRKVTRFREGGEDALEAEVLRLEREQRRVHREEEEEGEREWVGYGSNVGRRKVKKDG